MKSRIKFSFIIPSLNEGRYIGDCLKSIKNQGRKDYEIIVVDSFSRDGTVKIAKGHGAKVLFERRKGPGIARNTGAKKAAGDILIFADADVRFGKGFLGKLEKKFDHDIGGCIFFLVLYDAKNRLQSLYYKSANYIAAFLNSIGVQMTAGSCFAYRKNVFRKAGGFNPKFMTNEDHDLADRASKIGKFVFCRDIVVYTSSRRVAKLGLFRSTKMYAKSTFTYFLNHGYLRDYWLPPARRE
ncbi:glycosyltransferase [Candidatus Woesearchaeota archaeon]|nr:glycosyltransferase [Candidatus Woesearchaeota archaeon]